MIMPERQSTVMRTFRGAWSLAGLVAGAAGLATSYAVANVLAIRDSPVVAVAELVIRLTPGAVVEQAIDSLGVADKPLLVGGILVVPRPALRLGRPPGGPRLVAAGARLRRAGRRSAWPPSRSRSRPPPTAYLPIAVGFVTWVVVLSAAHRPARGAAAGADRGS